MGDCGKGSAFLFETRRTGLLEVSPSLTGARLLVCGMLVL